MIRVLRVQNLAVVQDLELELGSGLNIITGETGSGKSILVKSLELLRGGRASPHLLRSGADRAVVEALIEPPTGEPYVVRRVITGQGRSRAYIDNQLCTVAILRERSVHWLDISSQHEHHTLTEPVTHLSWLDRFAGHADRVDALGALVALAEQTSRDLAAFRKTLAEQADQADLLRFQVGEINDVNPQPGELDDVLTCIDRLTHAETLERAAKQAASTLHARDRSAVTHALKAQSTIRVVAERDQDLQPLLDRLDSVVVDLEDIAGDLMDYALRQEPDPSELARLSQREVALSKLVRRHGDLQTALTHRDRLALSLEELENADATLDGLVKTAEAALDAAQSEALQLSATRHAHAQKLAEAVTTQLAALGMGAARIQVSLQPRPEAERSLSANGARLSSDGIDQAAFLIAPNPGEEPRGLAEVASGGELSRALLALKQVLASFGPSRTYVFDEVDTGVGGAIAEAIGRKLHEVARHHQVVCITHQAVIAAWADQHLVVSKAIHDGRTATQVRTLTDSERPEELARMLGGAEMTDGVRQAARDLLQGAQP